MSLLRVDASVRVDGSVSRGIADAAEAAWQAEHPGVPVVRRELALDPLPAGAWPEAASAMWTPPESLGVQQRAATALVTALADEVLAAEAFIVAVPLYNYGISQHMKTWIDLLMVDPRVGPRGDQPLAGRPLILAIARGGGYGPGAPKEGWDHATPYLRRIFGDVFGLDVREAAAELTLAPHTPGMEELIDASVESEGAARGVAAEHGVAVARQLADTAAA